MNKYAFNTVNIKIIKPSSKFNTQRGNIFWNVMHLLDMH